ncbi:hypothetical protein [Brachybacterium subflavum]|uniref:hypothetical protein n=1 Tax=Brachybacterium subflavum TaxID=2585206 RepID=UPI00126641A6|nr:hypothetical protein [Brachybacterium subflavum]
MTESPNTPETPRATGTPQPPEPAETPAEAAAPGGAGDAAATATAPTGGGLLRRMAATPAASAIGAMSDPTKPPKPKVDAKLTTRRMVTVGMLLPLFMLFVMPMIMTGMTTKTAPHHMEVAVIGSGESADELTDQLSSSSGDSFDVSQVSSVQNAKTKLAEHDLRAAYDPEKATVYVAGANGRQVTATVTTYFENVAQQQDQELTQKDVVPLEDDDPSGTAALYLSLGAILGGFMTGIILSLMPASSKVRLVLGLVMPAVFATGMIVYGWALFGIFSGVAVMPWVMLYLLSLTACAVTSGLMLAIGPAAMPIAIVLIPLLGMSSSGVAAPLDMIGGFYRGMHTWVFSAQGISGVRDALYFDDAPLTAPVLVLCAWLLGGILLAALGTIRQKRRHLFAMLSEREEAQTALAVGAATA